MEQKYIGRFLILEEIASGGQATVYLSRDTNTWLLVALKVLHPHLARDTAYLERFHREASLTASIDHPNIIRIVEVGQHGSSHFIAMEYVPQNLQSFLIAEAKLPLERAVSIAFQVALGLEAARVKGIVHRDIKPHNILLTDEGVVKVTDFGIALGDGPGLTRIGMVLGTPQYMSPEQCRGLQADSRSDIYSLGVVLYQMLAGKVPFTGDTVEEVIRQHQDSQPIPVNELNPEISQDLAHAVGRCLEKDPDRRFQTPAEVADALGRSVLRRPSPGDTMIEEPQALFSQTTPNRPRDPEGASRLNRKFLIWGGLAAVPFVALVALLIILLVRNGTPVVILETNLTLEPGQTRSFPLPHEDLRTMLIAVEATVAGNGLDVTVELPDSDPPTQLLHQDLIGPKAEVVLPILAKYRDRAMRILLHNSTGQSTDVTLKVTANPTISPADTVIQDLTVAPIPPAQPPPMTPTLTSEPAPPTPTPTPPLPLSVIDIYLNAINSGDTAALVAIWDDSATTSFGSPCPEGQFKSLNGKLDILADEFEKIFNKAQIVFSSISVADDVVSANFTYADDQCKSVGLDQISGVIELTVVRGRITSASTGPSPRVDAIDAEGHYLLGLQLHEEGKFLDAISEFDEAIRLKPDFAEAYRDRGGANFKLRRCQLAVEDYNAAIRIDVKLAGVFKGRADARRCLGQTG